MKVVLRQLGAARAPGAPTSNESAFLAVIRKCEISVERAEHAFRLLAWEFGLTPAARGRLDLHLPSESSLDEIDELAALMNEARSHRETGNAE
jgi:hypothetical protein